MKKCTSILTGIIESRNLKEQIQSIDREILQHEKPNVWNVHEKDNLERKMEVDFNKLALAYSSKLNQDAKKMSVFDFYSAIELFEQQKPSK